MLRYLYQASTTKFEDLLCELFELEAPIGPMFQQQVRDPNNQCFDGVISQQPFALYIETKHHSNLNSDQIRRYISSIGKTIFNLGTSSRGDTMLIGLTKDEIIEEERSYLADLATASGLSFASITFQHLLNTLERICTSEIPSLVPVYQDYANYLETEQLLPRDILKGFPCRHTLDFNLKHHMYTVSAGTSLHLNCRFIGFYVDKCITHVAEIETVVEGSYDSESGSFEIMRPLRNKLDDDGRERVISMNLDHCELNGIPVRYYLLSEPLETNFKKTTKYGLYKSKNFVLNELIDGYVDGATTVEEIALGLRGKTW